MFYNMLVKVFIANISHMLLFKLEMVISISA